MITFVFNEDDSRLLMRDIEDAIEFLYPSQVGENGISIDESFELAMKSAAPIQFLSQRLPMLALVLSMLYDANDWPRAVDKKLTMKLINEAVDEIRNEPEELGS